MFMSAALTMRVAKLVMVASLASFAFMVTLNNILDYNSNFEFVRHVLSMDTIPPANPLRYRAITAPWLWHVGYAAIIATEGLTCLAFSAGTTMLGRHLHSNAALFGGAKSFAVMGVVLAFLLWFTGFMVAGGEWFLMWQSPSWNGQQAAFRFIMPMLGVLIALNQPDQELPG
jgi:predicted small integral membrane protein